jgi:hypothetical protein
MSSEPNILVERHHIPLSVYLQLYGSNSSASGEHSARANQSPLQFSATRFSNNSAAGSTRTGRPSTGINHGQSPQQQSQQTTHRSRVRIETLNTGDENDVNLFNALFTALINPARADSMNLQQSNGLSTTQITDNSTTLTYSDTEYDSPGHSSVCSICTLDYEPHQELRSLDQCDHRFHIGCIDRWLADHNTCPLCRASVLPTNSQREPRTVPSSASTRNSHSDLNGID